MCRNRAWRWRRGGSILASLPWVALTVACAGTASQPSLQPAASADSIVVVIDNATQQRVRVFTRFDESEALRLGEVSTNRTRSYVVAVAGVELQLGIIRASADRSRDPRWSNPVPVAAEDSLVCRLEATGPNSVGVILTRAGQRGEGNPD